MPRSSSPGSLKQSKTFRILINTLFFLVIFWGIQTWQQRNMAAGVAPDFQSTLLDGATKKLSSYQGKPLILHFWSTTCPICRLEEDSISDLARDKDTQILTVAFYSGGSNAVILYLNNRKLTHWPVVLDPEGELGKKFGVFATPSTFYIGPHGKIRYKTIGFTSKWGMKIRLWLAGL